jgi:hypothetical protein
MAHYGRIARANVPAHRNPGEAERKRGLKFPKRFRGARTAGVAVCDQPDPMPAGDLLPGKVEDVAIQASDRRAKHVQDVQRGHRAEWSNLVEDDVLLLIIARIPSDA